MDALLIGTGGMLGWPEPDCSCASCMRARAAGLSRAPGQVLIDGTLLLIPGQPPRPASAGRAGAGHTVRPVPGGWDILGPDRRRLLAAAGPGEVPDPPAGSAPFDVALLDLLASPAQLGRLRARGLVHRRTVVATLYADHRVTSEPELARRCGLWGVAVGRDGDALSSDLPSSSAHATGQSPAGEAVVQARPHRTLIIGGARSGKSREAELRLAGEPSVTYLAAGPWTNDASGAADGEWAARVAAHRAARPVWWRTQESLDVADALRTERGALLIDGIGTWLAAVMEQAGAWAPDTAVEDAAAQVAARIDELVQAWRQTSALVVAVTDQVGEGLVPAYPAGRAFRDQLGWLNQRLAAESDLSLQLVAGRVVALPA